MNRLKRWLRPTTFKRGLFYGLGEAFVVPAGLAIAAGLTGQSLSTTQFLGLSLMGLTSLVVFGLLTGFYRMKWSCFGLPEAKRVLISTALSGALMALAGMGWGISTDLMVVWWLVAFVGLSGLRSLKVLWLDALRWIKNLGKPRCLVVSDGSHHILAALNYWPDFRYKVVGLVDDRPEDAGALVRGKPVLGGIDQLAEIIQKTRARFVLMVEEPGSNHKLQKVWEQVEMTQAKLMVVEQLNPARPRPLMIKDLIPRKPVQLNLKQLSRAFEGRRVLITGAGGSIGSELARRIASFKPERVILVEKDETNLFRVQQELSEHDVDVVPFLGDISVKEHVEQVFFEQWPDTVFHAAAFKHVPMMEAYPHRAVINNILGTYLVAEASRTVQASVMVNISTDKAVRPTSVMGASKRVAELLLNAMNESGGTRFVSVRFGNVIGSRGSVLELFEKAIDQGKALRITHPDMKRYFMLIHEAVLLVLQAAVSESSGIFVLNMGEPVRIQELAEKLIRLKGKTRVKTVITGPRPGEKMVEELFWPHERVEPVLDNAMFKVMTKAPELKQILEQVEELVLLSQQAGTQELRQRLMAVAWQSQAKQEVVEYADADVADGVLQAG